MLPKFRALRASHFPMSQIEHEVEKQPRCCDGIKAAQAPQSQQPPFVSVQLDELAPLSGKQTSWGFPCHCQVRPAREVCLSLLSRNKYLGSIGSSSRVNPCSRTASSQAAAQGKSKSTPKPCRYINHPSFHRYILHLRRAKALYEPYIDQEVTPNTLQKQQSPGQDAPGFSSTEVQAGKENPTSCSCCQGNSGRKNIW